MKNKEIVEQVIQAFFDGDIEKALSYMHEEIQMGWPGYFDLNPGKKAVRDFFKTVPEIQEAVTEELIAEGDKVIGTGYVISKHDDGNTRKSFFSDVYTMDNGKVKSLRSYMVFEQKEE